MFSNEEQEAFLEKFTFWLNVAGLDPRRQGALKVATWVFGLADMIGQCFLMTLLIFDAKDLGALALSLEAFPTIIQTIAKIIALAYHGKILMKFFNLMQELWPWDVFGSELEAELREIYALITRLYKALNYIYLANLLLFSLNPVFIQEKVLPALRYNFCDLSGDICYYVTYASQLVEFSCICSVNLGFDALFCCIMTYIYCELAIIKYGFQHYHTKKSGRAFSKTYSDLIDHHNMMLDFIKEINKLYSIVLFCQFGATVITICIEMIITHGEGFPPNLIHVTKNGSFVVAYLLQLGIYCLGGSQITSQCESVADAAYSSNWLDYDSKLMKATLLIIQRSQSPVTLQMGGMMILNLEAFVSILNFTISFGTLIRNYL